jgi:predicted transcriptional regulator
MKQNFFYSHLIETTDISIRLTEMDLTKDEKVHLTSLLEANIHSTIVHNILSELSEEDKKVFLKNLVNNKHQKTLDHLGAKIEKLEDKIKKSVEDLKKELLKDLVQAQKN